MSNENEHDGDETRDLIAERAYAILFGLCQQDSPWGDDPDHDNWELLTDPEWLGREGCD